MLNIDQEKIEEFIHQLSDFQTEANKTASVEVYDRYTVNKLEEHIIDLYQLSVDASHDGLQYLCQHMRENIRNHLLTGTNITSDEFSLMAEWKSLVKAYLTHQDNQKVINALVLNLSKPGWASPIGQAQKDRLVSILFGGKSQPGELPVEHSEPQVADTEFDAYMHESSSSLADVFQSISEITDADEDEDINNIASQLQADEPSLAQCFEDLESNACNETAISSFNFSNDEDSLEKFSLTENPLMDNQDELAFDNNNQLTQVNQSAEIDETESTAMEQMVAGDITKKDGLESHQTDFDFSGNLSNKKISGQTNSNGAISSSNAVANELFVADAEDAGQDYDDAAFEQDLSVAHASFENNGADVNIEVSKEELDQITPPASASVEDELYVGDAEDAGQDYDDAAFEQDLSVAHAPFENNGADVNIEVSKEELDQITPPVSSPIEDELFVADTEDTAQDYDDAAFEQDLSVAHASFENDEGDVNLEVSKQDHDRITSSASVQNDELPDGFNDDLAVSYENEIDNNPGYIEPDIHYQQGPELDKNEVSAAMDGSMSIAEEVLLQTQAPQQEDTAEDETYDFIDTSIEEAIPFTDNQKLEAGCDGLATNDEGFAGEKDIEVQTVYIEPVQQQEERPEPKSIIEAYVDALSNKPKQLEQELIDQQVSPGEVQKREPIEKILEKYSDWNSEQKELLGLILKEVDDVIEQQDSVLEVLNAPADEGQVLEMVSFYTEQIERMGSAAEMVGLSALHKLCELIGFHFGDLARSSTEKIVASKTRIRQWPYIVYDYLQDIYNEKGHQQALEYISDDEWARTIREDIKSDLRQAFLQATIVVEGSDRQQRLTTATAENINIEVPDDVQSELLDGLLQELPNQTQQLSVAIQELTGNEFLNQLEVAQRIAHTIKGAANTVGITGIATLTHQLEDILQALLKAQTRPGAGLQLALVDASDCLEQMTESLLGQGVSPADAVQTLQVILDWANYIDEYGPPGDEDSEQFPHTGRLKSTASGVEQSPQQASNGPQEASLRVPSNMIDELVNQSGESIIATSQMQENVRHLLRSLREIKTNREDVYKLSQKLEHLIDVQGADNKFIVNKKSEKFDPLEMDQYNELHTFSRRLIEATADSVELVKELEGQIHSLESMIADQSRIQKDNQYTILKTRMTPVESIVARLKRGVRQSAKLTQKNVELEVLGTEMLLDNKILNQLVDPLMHILRNAVDHGIESDETRLQQGKTLPAVITLSFQQVGERLDIVCQDDGQGLDTAAIQSRAIERGLIDNGQSLTEAEIQQIIMQHGFSTRDQVTQLSGRGVGMDVVCSSIKALNGSVEIHSQKGIGMKVELSLPVSLLTAHVLLASTRDGTVAVSTRGIEEILQADVDNIKETDQGLMFTHEGNVYSAIHLEQLINDGWVKNDKKQLYSALLVEAPGTGQKVILVDDIQSVRDIIIKPLSHYLPKVSGLVGATVLGNGEVAVVVDIADLLSDQVGITGKINRVAEHQLEEIHQASVLVVEDSISTRRSLAEFMQDLNYQVFTAKDGVEAIEIMRQHRPTILLTDLEMPRMNGLELTSYVKSHDETKDIPVIMLTSRTTEKHKQEAKSIGVDEYLTKPFVEDILLEKVQLHSTLT